MYVTTCRRCGETILNDGQNPQTIECAGEIHRVCRTCYEQFRRWFLNPSAPTDAAAPELEEEAAEQR